MPPDDHGQGEGGEQHHQLCTVYRDATYCLSAPAAMPAIKWRWARRKATITGIAATTIAAIVSFKVGASWPMKARPTCSVRISGLGAMIRGHRSWSQLCRNVSSASVAIAGR